MRFSAVAVDLSLELLGLGDNRAEVVLKAAGGLGPIESTHHLVMLHGQRCSEGALDISPSLSGADVLTSKRK
jgi:hypothetical protein